MGSILRIWFDDGREDCERPEPNGACPAKVDTDLPWRQKPGGVCVEIALQAREPCHEAKVCAVGGVTKPRTSGLDARPLSRTVRGRFGPCSGICPGNCARLAATAHGLHTGRLSPLSRRDPERPRHYRMPQMSEGQPERGVPGGVRAVSQVRAGQAEVCVISLSYPCRCELLRSKHLLIRAVW